MDTWTTTQSTTAAAERVSAFLWKVYAWMAIGLGITAVIAYGVASSPEILRVLARSAAHLGENDAALTEFQRALKLDGDLDEAHRLAGINLGQRGQQGEGFYHLAVASQLRGDLEQALNQFERSDELLADTSPRKPEVEKAIEELRQAGFWSEEIGVAVRSGEAQDGVEGGRVVPVEGLELRADDVVGCHGDSPPALEPDPITSKRRDR